MTIAEETGAAEPPYEEHDPEGPSAPVTAWDLESLVDAMSVLSPLVSELPRA